MSVGQVITLTNLGIHEHSDVLKFRAGYYYTAEIVEVSRAYRSLGQVHLWLGLARVG